MRKSFVFMMILFLLFTNGFTIDTNSILKQGRKKKISKLLKPHWTLKISKNKIIIASRIKIWFYNCVSLPHYPDKQVFFKEVVKKGRQDYFRVTYVFKAKWSLAKLKQAKIHNRKIWRQIKALPKQYKLTHLIRTKQNSFYSKNVEEQKRIKQYERDYARIKAQTLILPDFHSRKHSIFLIENRMGFECVWIPERINLPLKRIQSIISNQ